MLWLRVGEDENDLRMEIVTREGKHNADQVSATPESIIGHSTKLT